MNRLIWTCFLVLLTLVACQPTPQAPVEAAAPTPLEQTASAPAEQMATPSHVRKLDRALPLRVELDIPFEFRGSRSYKAEDGTARKNASIEFFRGDALTVQQEIRLALLRAGYTAGSEPTELKKNRYSTTYTGDNLPTLEVVSNSSRTVKRKNKDAVGVVRFDWPE